MGAQHQWTFAVAFDVEVGEVPRGGHGRPTSARERDLDTVSRKCIGAS
ncbi:MAG: hypothetical protein IT196_03730 [Acidimicrobiales bacterium]|nr:hypothetical protein [Acidimicrobiales bacterium]